MMKTLQKYFFKNNFPTPMTDSAPPPLVNEELIVNVMTVLWFNCQLSILNAQIINAPPHAIDNQNQAITGLGLML